MGAAVDSGVIREHVLGFLSVPLAPWLRLWGANYKSVGHHWFAAPKRKQFRGASDDFYHYQRICLGEKFAARCQRNELAETQFNESEA
jgi:hypothetical protein